MNDCECSNTKLRYATITQVGRQQYKQFKNQCLDCGKVSSPISYAKLSDHEMSHASEVDKEITRQYWAARKEAAAIKYQKSTNDFFRKHSAYLRSPEWKERRMNALRRDGYICQACLQNPASQVHHLTYDHWGHEPLFDLVSVCKPCHDKLTEMDRARRNGQKSEPVLYGEVEL